MKNTEQGFTLFEVLISMFIAGVAVLGLVMLELNILRSSQSSFNYTIATIEANTLVDRVWRNLCVINGTKTPADVAGIPGRYNTLFEAWEGDLVNSGFTGMTSRVSNGTPTLGGTDTVTVSWHDKNFEASANDSITLNVPYPDFSAKCK